MYLGILWCFGEWAVSYGLLRMFGLKVYTSSLLLVLLLVVAIVEDDVARASRTVLDQNNPINLSR